MGIFFTKSSDFRSVWFSFDLGMPVSIKLARTESVFCREFAKYYSGGNQMYIIHNAWKSIVRNKGRNIMIGIIALVIAVSACVSLSIREAAETTRQKTLSGMSVTAQISYNRAAAMQSLMQSQTSDSSSGEFDRGNFDFSALQGKSLTFDELTNYTKALTSEDSYYYTLSASLSATGDLEPYSASSDTSSSSSDSSTASSTAASGNSIVLNNSIALNTSVLQSNSIVKMDTASSDSSSSDSSSSDSSSSNDSSSSSDSSASDSSSSSSSSESNSGNFSNSSNTNGFGVTNGSGNTNGGNTNGSGNASASGNDNGAGDLDASGNANFDAQNNSGETQNGPMGMDFRSNGDFSITGYSSYNAMLSLFGEDGTCSITSGQMFDADTSDPVCVISNELAMYNNLSVGDQITLSNPNYTDETYTLTIVGIYTNSSSDTGNSRFARSDPANNIYMSYNSLNAIITQSVASANTMTNQSGETVSAALTNEPQFTYVFPTVANYNAFVSSVTAMGLSSDYTITSSDLTSFENSIRPLETLSTMAGWFFLVVLIIGGIILVVLNIFNLRERKYEVGVLTAIGMKKWKVASQFVCELLCITFIAIIIGAGVGAATSVPVTNALLANEISSSQSTTQNVAGRFGVNENEIQGNIPNMGTFARGENSASGTNSVQSYVNSVSNATNLTVILELIGVGIFLTILSSLAALVTIMRYEPLKILSNRA